MKKILERIERKIRDLKFEKWKRNFSEFTSFEIAEDGKIFIISLKFDTTIFIDNRKEISEFIEKALIKEAIDIFTVLEIVRIRYNVNYVSEGENDGTKVSLYFK